MSALRKILREEYNRLKKAFERLTDSKKQQAIPQPAWQPVRDKKRY